MKSTIRTHRILSGINIVKYQHFQPKYQSRQWRKHTTQTHLSSPVPKGTWDSHMHVVDPGRFPLSSSAKYKPPAHTVDDMRSFYADLGATDMKAVIVQPSIYGNDNSCTLSALRELGVRDGRAIVQFDPKSISERELRQWHDIGVRGVRVNLVSVGRDLTGAELKSELEVYAKVLRDLKLDWVLQLYIPLKLAKELEDIVPALGVKVCIDHFGSPTLPDFDASRELKPYELPGFESLVEMLLKGQTWVKISGQYRISRDPEGLYRDLAPLGRELLKEAGNRVVWASDWPHTRFEGIDSGKWIEICYEWCGEGTGLKEKLFTTNAEELWL